MGTEESILAIMDALDAEDWCQEHHQDHREECQVGLELFLPRVLPIIAAENTWTHLVCQIECEKC